MSSWFVTRGSWFALGRLRRATDRGPRPRWLMLQSQHLFVETRGTLSHGGPDSARGGHSLLTAHLAVPATAGGRGNLHRAGVRLHDSDQRPLLIPSPRGDPSRQR